MECLVFIEMRALSSLLLACRCLFYSPSLSFASLALALCGFSATDDNCFFRYYPAITHTGGVKSQQTHMAMMMMMMKVRDFIKESDSKPQEYFLRLHPQIEFKFFVLCAADV
jgi:hypothetical protein